VGGYVDSGQNMLFQGNNLVSQGSDMKEFERSMSPEIQGVGLQRKAALVHGSHSRTTSCAIPKERSSCDSQESRCVGGFGDPHPQ
jgi:hypothetical protein